MSLVLGSCSSVCFAFRLSFKGFWTALWFSNLAWRCLGIFLDRLNEEDEDEDEVEVNDADEEQEKK